VKTFVYPFGEWNDTIIGYVKDAGYLCAREAKPESYRLNGSDPVARFRICSWQVTNQSMDAFKQILSHAAGDEVVVLTYHFLSDNASKATYISIQNFREQMSYLKENNFDVVLLSDFFAVNEEPSSLLPYFAVAILGAGFAVVSIGFYLRLHKTGKLNNRIHGKEKENTALSM
jgi:hypothetical protein